MKHFLAIDCGATSGRAVLGSTDGSSLSMTEVYRFPNQPLELNGKFYWNVYSIYEHIVNCLTKLGRDGVELTSIGIDTWGVDFGCIGADGSLLGLPRAYRDPFTDGVPEKVFAVVPRDELYELTGIQVMNFNTIFQLHAMLEEGSEPLRHASKLLFMPDLLSYMLTGNAVCESTIASTSGLVDAKSQDMSVALMQRLGMDSTLWPKMVQPSTMVGRLTPRLAALTGLGEVPVVAVAGHDTASAVAAVPATEPGFAYLSSGTWSLMGVETEHPVVNSLSARLNFTNEGGIEGTTRLLKNITGMWLLEQSRRVWQREGRDYTYPQMVAMAAENEAYAGRISPDDARFANPADMVAEIYAALNEQGQPLPTNDGELIACIYHSLADRYAEVVGMLNQLTERPIEKLHIIGGGAANDLLNQWTADRLQMTVVAGPTEATAMGNLLMQAKAAGVVADRWQMRRLVASASQLRSFSPKR